MRDGKPAFYDSLAEALDTSWNFLGRGVADRRSGFHTLSVGTLSREGRPRVRTVVSRSVDRQTRTLRFHCDVRSDKFAELQAQPLVAVHGYDAAEKVQIRIEGTARLHTDDAVADDAWLCSRASSRVCYGTVPGPGVVIESGGDFELPAGEAEIAGGRANFCAVVVTVERLEFLYLAFEGHRRARFTFVAGQTLAEWLVP